MDGFSLKKFLDEFALLYEGGVAKKGILWHVRQNAADLCNKMHA